MNHLDHSRRGRVVATGDAANGLSDRRVEGIRRGEFNVLCPDNEVTREVDVRRILCAAENITACRPAPSHLQER